MAKDLHKNKDKEQLWYRTYRMTGRIIEWSIIAVRSMFIDHYFLKCNKCQS